MKNALIIFAITLAAYTLTAGGDLYSPDEEVLFRATRSLYEEHDLSIEPLGPGGFATSRNKEGQEYAQYGVGQMILALPFYAAGKALAEKMDYETWWSWYGIKADEVKAVSFFPVSAEEIAPRFACSFFNIVASALLAAVLYLLMYEMTTHAAASFFTAIFYALGSLAWAHSRPFFTEISAVLMILIAWYALLRGTRGRMALWSFIAGAFAGFAALVRMDSILLYPGLAIVLLGPVREFIPLQKPKLHPWIAFCIPAALCGVTLLVLNTRHFGGPFASGYSDQPEGVKFSTPMLAGLYGFLFSAGKGLFFFSPFLLLNLWSWGGMHRRNRGLTYAVAASVLVPLLILSKWQNWTGGWCWGPRHIFMIHPFLAIPIAYWLARGWRSRALPWRRSAALALGIVGIAVQLFGASEDFIKFYMIFFRDPQQNFKVMFDPLDDQYWGRYYKLAVQTSPEAQPRRSPTLGFTPAPTQHSIYLPQNSVWAGYPIMWRSGMIDNLWARLWIQTQDDRPNPQSPMAER